MTEPRPIRVFYSSLDERFYASQYYKEIAPRVFEITGKKFDVTADIASAVIRDGLEFRKHTPDAGPRGNERSATD